MSSQEWLFGLKEYDPETMGGVPDSKDGAELFPILEEVKNGKRTKRRSTMCYELSQKYEYRRAASEVKLLEAMKYRPMKEGYTYNFLTQGDVDGMSYLKIVLNQHSLDHLIVATWCAAAEDILQLQQWHEDGRIRHFDMYMGEILPSSYKIEWQMVKDFYDSHPDVGRVAVFRNHAKIFAGCNIEENFYFGVQTSANINSNPRTENACITIDKGLYEFYKGYFDGINSFE
ncbi:MAG: hypothetical protein LUD72_06200 [Bacteroidales bacterium]|nr:hypothetical protein [Bacteroidales bacterium]